jgi:hypothetical protein
MNAMMFPTGALGPVQRMRSLSIKSDGYNQIHLEPFYATFKDEPDGGNPDQVRVRSFCRYDRCDVLR